MKMKMNKKIIVPVLALGMGVALVGSVSSTLAWYQYSTKAQAAYIGTSVGNSENLEVRYRNSANTDWEGWKNNLTSTDVDRLVTDGYGTNIIPVTTGAQTKNTNVPAATSFYSGVETGVAGYGGHTAANANVVQFTLFFRYRKTNSDSTYAAKNLNLVDLTIVDTTEDGHDLYKAVRVHFSAGTTYSLFARDKATNDSENAEVTTNTYGNLDTDNDGVFDKAMTYEWEAEGSTVMYGVDGSQQVAYNAAVADLNQTIGAIPANENGLAVTVTMWIEGWQKLSQVPAGNKDIGNDPLDPQPSAMWKPEVYANKQFKVGMRFQAVDAA